jgi:acyl-CoA synthetase (AMP-forming)/AMP-acid ligase II
MTPAYRLAAPEAQFEEWALPRILRQRAAETPDRPFLAWTHDHAPVSYRDFDDVVSRVASALVARGIRKGDRVALMMGNSLAHVAAWLALGSLGAIDAPLNPAYRGQSLAHAIRVVRPVAIICDRSLRAQLDEALAHVSNGPVVDIVLHDD